MSTAIIILSVALLFIGFFGGIATIETPNREEEEFPLLTEEQKDLNWLYAQGNEAEYQRLCEFDTRISMMEVEYQLRHSVDPTLTLKQYKVFKRMEKEYPHLCG